ncbi:UNVERIFIED_ORG: hypothetical protein J2W19_003110 [Shinella zoogloeoides]|nr:hypothetical protein [Shinella zoogloeoides]
MSSDTRPTVSSADMKMIRSLLFRAGYSAGSPIEGEFRADTATAMLIERVRDGETSPAVLERFLGNSYGRPEPETELFKSGLPQFAIQGLPARAAYRIRQAETK